jgi:hypothetical protein
MVVTEKIDGSNAAFVIETTYQSTYPPQSLRANEAHVDGYIYRFAAQSRKRIITPEDDNFGFAKWAYSNASALIRILGEGRHFGEWWGSGIQRGYNLPKGEKRFSLFNTPRWRETDLSELPGLWTVPELYVGEFSVEKIEEIKDTLLREGSEASPGFLNPEGVVVYHTASRSAYKSTYDDCDHGEGGKTWKPQV